MAVISFDYSAISSAQSYAKKVANAWYCMDDYKSGLQNGLHAPLDEWKIAGEEPYGHGYLQSAQQKITEKKNDLETKKGQWITLSNNLGNFLQYIKDKDQEAASVFLNLSNSYVDYSGVGGFFRGIGDWAYNTLAVDFANCNGFTRGIADWSKQRLDDFSVLKQDLADWFKHGQGRYVLNIVGSLALTTAAIAGTVIAVIGIPFTGGSSAVIAVGCIGAIASGVAAACSAYNTFYTVKENSEALRIDDDPGMARFHGDVAKYSDYVTKTDFGSKKANERADAWAKTVDTTQTVAEVISCGCSLATTFGTKSVELIDDAGNITKYTQFDFSPSNIKTNVLKTFGFKVENKTMTVDKAGVAQSTYVSGDAAGDTTIEAVRSSTEATYSDRIFEKTIDKTGKTKTVTKTVTFNKATVNTEYGSIVASNGAVTQEFAAYSTHATASSTTIDYSKAVSTSKSVAKAKAASDGIAKKSLNVVKTGSKTVSTVTSKLKSTESTSGAEFVYNTFKKNYFFEQVDKYVIQYDAAKGDVYVGGDMGKKIVKAGSQIWKDITSSAA